MGRPLYRLEPEIEETSELDLTVVAVVAAVAVGAVVLSWAAWRRYGQALGETKASSQLLRQLDSARDQLRRQVSSGQTERADETRIRIAELQRAIMQLEGYI